MAPVNKTPAEAAIFLIGFMGSGKSTVGRELARLLECDFFDLDQIIEARAGKTVAEIFAEWGESEFRRQEAEAIRSCSELKRAVVALGGGAYASQENRDSLRAIGKTVWLDCPLEVCLKRIKDDGSRPLLGSEDEMRALLEIRRPSYVQADYFVTTGERAADETALNIMRMLGLTTR